jgi:6-methylsalicylate decarboxylase
MTRVDTHHHMIPPDHRKMLRAAGIDEAGGRAPHEWSPEASLHTMAELDVATAILSVYTRNHVSTQGRGRRRPGP